MTTVITKTESWTSLRFRQDIQELDSQQKSALLRELTLKRALFEFTGKPYDKKMYQFAIQCLNGEKPKLLEQRTRRPRNGKMIIIKKGENHLYVYVGNRALNKIDRRGLWNDTESDSGVIRENQCRGVAESIIEEGRRRYPWTPDDRNNHMRHCWASCRVAQLGGNACAFITGWVNELRGAYDPADVEANAKGRNCASSSDCATCCQGCQSR